MKDRAKFVPHRGRRIFLIDVSGLTPPEILEVIDYSTPVIRSQPEGSVLTLTRVDNTRVEPSAARALMEFTRGNKPFVRAAAVVGLKGLQRVVLNSIISVTRRKFALFDELAPAMDFLAEQEG